MRTLLALLCLASLAACEYDPAGTPPGVGAPLEPLPPRVSPAPPYERPWPTASDAVTAECSALCRWEVRCAGAELGACEADCYDRLCDGVDCELPPSGTDAQLELCVRSLHLEAASPYACAAGDAPSTYTEPCAKRVRPACGDETGEPGGETR